MLKSDRLLGPVLDSNIDNDLSVLNTDADTAATVAEFLGVPLFSPISALLPYDLRSASNHSFIQDYMADGLPSRKDIDKEMKRLADAVPFPTPTPTPKSYSISAAIRANLTDITYGGAFDVDLSVDRSVPPGAPSGVISSFLPSGRIAIGVSHNYSLGCLAVRPGTYEIGAAVYDAVEFSTDRAKCVDRALYNQFAHLAYGDSPEIESRFCDTITPNLMAARTLTANLNLTLGDGTKLSKPVKFNVNYRIGSISAEYIEGSLIRGHPFPASIIYPVFPDPKNYFIVRVTENVDPITQKRFATYSVE